MWSRRAPSARAVVAVLALLGICACSSPEAPQAEPLPLSTASASAQPNSAAEETCGFSAPDGAKIEDLKIRTVDGVTLTAAALGRGPVGVVLLHQTNAGLCGWMPYATRLAGASFAVVAFDFRCTFDSGCLEGERQYALLSDVEAAASTLRERGATEVAVVGASLGGAVAVGACAKVEVDRCAALSAAVFDRKLGGGVTANKAVGRLRKPLLYAVAPDDPSSSLADGRTLVARAPKGTVTFVELPAGSGHGWDVVSAINDPATPSTFAAELESFLRG